MNCYSSILQVPYPLRENANFICSLVEYGLIEIKGRDAKKFLQGQLTCDLEEIILSQSRLGAHCNPQGRVLSLFHIFLFKDSYYLLMPQCLIAIAMKALKKYAIFYPVTLTDVSNDFSILGYIGDKKNIEKHNKESEYTIIQPIENATIKRYLLAGNKEIMTQVQAQLTHSSLIISSDRWKQLDMHDSIPAIYPETSGKFLPHEINLDKLGAIHLNKGCYTGQEIITRMHYRAKLKNHLYLAKISNSFNLLPGTDVYSYYHKEKKISGVIVDVSAHHEVLLVTDESHAKNNHLFLNENDKEFFTLAF